MTEPKDITYEELTDGLQHPFWRWFAAQALNEWGDAGFGIKVSKIVANTKPDEAGEAIRQATAVKGAVDRLFSLPKQRLESLKQADDRKHHAESPGRRPVGV